ncbi:hypothetical protein FisN_1Lh360 [Fistulifera solaris]|uniref:Nucleoporin Nup54 alpha-helical domain-containing protein n=1 Tax=Fistulifera solaris TaxID=1519565 RepID=A0A1Z5K405_FISSO|nr:hypothetical protein FisN_1Lh360 [Fistulifera solaris]|eukprot:GAX20974.1 hypothetical protein FisN_1Lh360 [Fistulifera solaris]
MVTWGSNTIHTVPQRSPAPTTTFGSPAPSTNFGAPAASSGLFGSASPSTAFGGTPSSSGIFGSAPSSGSLFGSTPSSGTFGAPAPSGGLFGSAPAPSTGLFGSAPSSGSLFGSTLAPSGGLFGNTSNTSSAPFSFSNAAPSSGLFGAPSTSGFSQQQQLPPTVPQQAAQQALLDASARQEEYRVQSALEKLNHAYQGTEIATDTKSAHFSVTLYHSVSPEIRQMQSLQGVGLDGKPLPIAPPRPPQISADDWTRAVVCNTDHENYMPVAVVGARALQARVQGQQEQANTCIQQLNDIQETAEVIRDRNHGANARLVEAEREQARLRKRMLAVMRKVEVLRCFGHPLQQGEVEAMHKLAEVEKQIYQNIQPVLQRLAENVRANAPSQPPTVALPNDLDELKGVLTKHREALSRMTTAVQQDKGDLELIQKRVQMKAPSSSSLF